MLTSDLQTQLINYTVANSGHEAHRPYVGLSGIADCDLELYQRYIHGQAWRVDDHLRSRLSFELEAALIARLSGLGVYSPGEEISLHNGLIQGHTDGVVDGQDLLEIKTVPLERYFPDGKLPRRVWWQVQAYMHFTQRKWAHIVYVARDSGYVKVFPARYSANLGDAVEAKVNRLANAILDLRAPACTCGRCGNIGG